MQRAVCLGDDRRGRDQCEHGCSISRRGLGSHALQGAFAAWCVGCHVTLDGTPLANATVGYTSAEATGLPPAYGVTDESGVYRLTSIGGRHGRGAVVGTFVVTVVKYESEDVPENEVRRAPPKVWPVVPELYGDIATSPLRATVGEGANTGAAFDFDVQSKPAKKP